MLDGWPLLSLIIFLPLVGAAFIIFIRGEDSIVSRNARNVALWTALINFVLPLVLWLEFDNTTSNFQFVEKMPWIDNTIGYHVGVDGISMLFVVLTGFLTPICILAS